MLYAACGVTIADDEHIGETILRVSAVSADRSSGGQVLDLTLAS
jgi:hypothetical protein